MTEKNIDDRVDIKSLLYLRICKEHCDRFLRLQKKLQNLMPRNGGSLYRIAMWKDFAALEECQAIVIVFTTMCLEAFIYDYAAHSFTDTFVRKYLDKLDLKSKWVVVPQLVTGKKFDTDGQAFELLKKLVKYRNKLVHAKSKHMPMQYADLRAVIKKSRAEEEDRLTIVENSLKTIRELLEELEKLDDRKGKPWWWEGIKTEVDRGTLI